MDNEQLVKSIRQLCKNRNIAISQLENDLNFGAGLISRWNKNSPSIDKIVDIANYFHVSLDEVVGYKLNKNDEFLNMLYEQTSSGSIVWENSEVMNKKGLMVKQYTDFYIHGEYLSDDDKETTYATCFNSGYIAIYAYHYYDKILYPYNLMLFIQPSNDSFLVNQHYTKEELAGLWVKILNSLGDNIPDEIKAEDMKNEFVSNYSFTNKITKKEDLSDIEKIIDDTAIMKLMEIYNKPEIQELQKTFNNPEFQMAIQVANKLQKYFKK